MGWPGIDIKEGQTELKLWPKPAPACKDCGALLTEGERRASLWDRCKKCENERLGVL